MIARDKRCCRMRVASFAACAPVALLLAGCQPGELPTEYGRRQAALAPASVNGTDVLAGMFEAAGHEVFGRRSLITSAMESIDAIVWFPDGFAAPSPDVCDWLEDWLDSRTGRTLIYVGRDYNAESLYWQKATALAPVAQRDDYRDRELISRAAAEFHRRRAKFDCPWFVIEGREPRQADELAGPWSLDIDGARAEIELTSRLVPHGDAESLLSDGDEGIVVRWKKSADSQLVAVLNGSFLLNLPLVNHEHRKLAARLIGILDKPSRIVFLESGAGGPPLDPPATDSSLWRVFGAWPLSVVLLHFAVLGIIFCFAQWPIFGRPRTVPTDVTANFGEHVEAVGKLLRRAKNPAYALSKLPKPKPLDAVHSPP
jgi:hypothetical protein